MEDHTATILSSDTQELLEARDAELKNVLRLKIILDEVRCLDLGAEQSPAVKRALKLVTLGDYLRLPDSDGDQDYVLDLQDCSSCPPLSYTDRKAIRTQLSANLQAKLTPIVELGDKMRAEMPHLFTKDADVRLSPEQQEILKLEQDYRINMEKLAEAQNEKCALLKTAAELRMGPHLVNELKVQQAQAQLSQTKTELLRSFFVNEIVSRTEHSLKAHKEVASHVDELLKANKPTTEAAKR